MTDSEAFYEVLNKIGRAGPGGVVLQTDEATALLQGVEAIIARANRYGTLYSGVCHSADRSAYQVRLLRRANEDLMDMNLRLQLALQAAGVDMPEVRAG